MLRIYTSKSTNSAKSYYESELSQAGNYYSEDNSEAGRWYGKSASLLGLEGPITKGQFEDLVSNQNPLTGSRITKFNRKDRRPGYDFNFNAPKSVSIAVEYAKASGNRKLAKSILDAMRFAVHQTMKNVEHNVQTRVRKNKVKYGHRVTGNFIYATFEHLCSRPSSILKIPDPSLHMHCFVPNLTFDYREGQWKAIEVGEIKENAPYYEAMFHSYLGQKLTDLGIKVKTNGRYCGIAGFSRNLIDKFSNRMKEIKSTARRLGITDKKGISNLAATTRLAKVKNLDEADLREEWMNRLSPQDKIAIERALGMAPEPIYTKNAKSKKAKTYTKHASSRPRLTPPPKSAGNIVKGVSLALDHHFERLSVVSLNQIKATVLRKFFGSATPEQVSRELKKRSDLIFRKVNGRTYVTSKAVLRREREMIRFVKNGRRASESLNPDYDETTPVYNFDEEKSFTLNRKQQRAVKHILSSTDSVIGVQGKAGTGKTTMLASVFKALEAKGVPVMGFAPSADASRGTLRNDGLAFRSKGMQSAQTVAALLRSESVQAKIAGGVLVIDEVGLLSTKEMQQVFAIAKAQAVKKVILVGDTAQHNAVRAGDAYRILQEQAGLKPAVLDDIIRQKGGYRDAVAKLGRGKIKAGFNQLCQLGFIKQYKNEKTRHRKLVSAYMKSIQKGRKSLVISPTHAEANKITSAIRQAMKDRGMLGFRTLNYSSYKSLQFTQSERSYAGSYSMGQYIRFHQKAPGIKKGETYKVTRVDENNVWIGSRKLPLHLAERFSVYREVNLDLRAGDQFRVTENSLSKCGKHRLNNGSIYKIKGFTIEGDIILNNDWVVSKTRGNLAFGFVSTSFASQGKTVSDVFISQSSESFPASSLQQLYVSASRGRHSMRLYTNDKKELLKFVSRSNKRMSAVEFMKGVDPRPKSQSTFSEILKDIWKVITSIKDALKGTATNQFNQSGGNYKATPKPAPKRAYNAPTLEMA